MQKWRQYLSVLLAVSMMLAYLPAAYAAEGMAETAGITDPADSVDTGDPADNEGGGDPADNEGEGGPADNEGEGGPADNEGEGGPANAEDTAGKPETKFETNGASPTDALKLTFDGDTLYPEDTRRLFLEGHETPIHKITYIYDEDKLVIDKDGNVSVKPGYEVGEGGESVAVTAQVEYYKPEDVLFYSDFENGATGFDKQGNSVKITDTSLISGQASRTGRYGITTKGINGCVNTGIDDPQPGTAVFWYYDPCTDKGTGAGQTQWMVAIVTGEPADSDNPNGFGNLAGISYNAAGHNGNSNYYTWRKGNLGVPSVVERSPGWHKIEYSVDADSGMTCYIDDTEIGTDSDLKEIGTLLLAYNWASQAGTQANIAGKHFIDDVYVVKKDAATESDSVETEIKIAPAAGTSNPEIILTFDAETLPKGETERLFVEENRTPVDEITYSYDADKLVIDEYGNVSVNPAYAVPGDGEDVTVTATVKAFSNKDVVWYEDFEHGFTSSDKNGFDANWNANHAFVTDTSLFPGGHASRTGRHGVTNGTTQAGITKKIPVGGGSMTFWYYDPCNEAHLTAETPEEDTIVKYGAGIHVSNRIAGVFYGNDAPRVHVGGNKYYGYRPYNTFRASEIERAPGWHKFVFTVENDGTYLSIDGTPVDKVANNTTIEEVLLATNWNTQNGMAPIRQRHFIDDMYVLLSGAEAGEEYELTATVRIAPKDYKVDPDQLEIDLANLEDATIAVTPDLDDLTSVKIGGTALEEASDYAISGNEITLLASGRMGGLTVGSHPIILSFRTGQSQETEITVSLKVENHEPRDYYVDSENGDDNRDGKTEGAAWRTLGKLSGKFYPGDRIFLKRGSVWNEQLVLTGSGKPGAAITLQPYGEGARPIVNGCGTGGTRIFHNIGPDEGDPNRKLSGAVELLNAGYWEISGLEVTNRDMDDILNGKEADDKHKGRWGIMVMNNYAESDSERTHDNWLASRKEHVYIRDCYVHHVNGSHQVFGGIKHAGGIGIMGLIDDILVERCRVDCVDNEGIRNHYFHPSGTYSANSYPKTVESKVVFANNYVSGCSGDGIVLAGGSTGSKMEHNVVTDCGRSYLTEVTGSGGSRRGEARDNGKSYLLSNHNYAAAWFMGCYDTVGQYNEVFANPYQCADGEAFDIDGFCKNVVYQYNYSARNNGGWILFMADSQDSNVLRYNISVEDGGYQPYPHLIYYAHSRRNLHEYPHIYNNTIIVPPNQPSGGEGVASLLDSSHDIAMVNFQNNLIYCENPERTLSMTARPNHKIIGGVFSNNLFWPQGLYDDSRFEDAVTVESNVFEAPLLAGPVGYQADLGVIAGNLSPSPRFDAGKLSGYKLQADSPAIGAGAAITHSTRIDETERVPLAEDIFGNRLVEEIPPDIGAHQYSSEMNAPPVTHSVTWHAGGGMPGPTQTTVEHGGTIAEPAAMTKANHTFGGWHSDSGFTAPAVFPVTNVTEDMVFWAKWLPAAPPTKAGVTIGGLSIADSTYNGAAHPGYTGAPTFTADRDGKAVTPTDATLTASYAGTANDGTSYVAGAPPAKAGSYAVTATLANDPDYAGTWTDTFTVRKATPFGTPAITSINQPGKTLADANLTGSFTAPYDNSTIPGALVWDLGSDTEVIANTAYTWTFTPTDTANYHTRSGSFTPYVPSPDEHGGSGSDRGGGGSDRGGGSGREDIDGSTGLSAAQAQNMWLERNLVISLANKARSQGEDWVRTRFTGVYCVRGAAWKNLKGLRYMHDTIIGDIVQVRVYIDTPEQFTADTKVSAYVKGRDVDETLNVFRKWFGNKMQAVCFDQQADWDQPVGIAALINLEDMDIRKLYFYSYDKAGNTYRRISAPSYRIDKNGYLHFTSPYAGTIVVSEGPLERK